MLRTSAFYLLFIMASVCIEPSEGRAEERRYEGGLSRNEILEIIQANDYQIRDCYEGLLKRAPRSRGHINVRFVIGVHGHVFVAVVKQASITDLPMQTCVIQAVGNWQFPKPRKAPAVEVLYPFTFSPSL